MPYFNNNKNLYFKILSCARFRSTYTNILPTVCFSSCGKLCPSDLKTQLWSSSTLLPYLKPFQWSQDNMNILTVVSKAPHDPAYLSDLYSLVLPPGLCTSCSLYSASLWDLVLLTSASSGRSNLTAPLCNCSLSWHPLFPSRDPVICRFLCLFVD